ncbi:MAG TPA: peptidylprolyl isomerase [Verrucomicrobiae bacterium]|nr:peptidylprolyl isomerase [Verrucomicrobiae bacterium]
MKPMSDPRALLREPLLHFILIGAAIFAWYKIASKPIAPSDTARILPSRIVVDGSKLRELMVNFEQNQGRVPTRAELSKLVDDWVREEVLCRAALAAGVDRNDPVIRQRLMNLMQWYLAGEGADGEPGQDALRRYYEGDSAGATNTILFEQIFFNPALRDSVLMEARKTLDLLQAGRLTGTEAAAARGDPLVVGGDKAEEELQLGRAEDLATNFGMPFIELVRRMPLDTWSGPIESSLGWHLVKHRLSGNPTTGEQRMQHRLQEHLDPTAPDVTYEDMRKRYEVEVAPFPAEVQK